MSHKRCTIGTNCLVNAGSYLECVHLHNHVLIGPNCSIVGVTHEYSERGVCAENSYNTVLIKKHAWVGAGCVVLPGVIIGEGAVVGAGSILRIQVPDHHMYVGTPLGFRITPISSAS